MPSGESAAKIYIIYIYIYIYIYWALYVWIVIVLDIEFFKSEERAQIKSRKEAGKKKNAE